jgi:HAMP domain-containing protein
MTSFVASNASLKAVDNAGLPPDKQDWLPVQAFVQAASADKNVLDVKVVDVSGVIRAASDPALVGKPDAPPPHEASDFVKDGMTVASIKDGRGRQGFRFVDPITYAGRSFGQVDLSLSKSELSAASTLTRGLMAMLSVIVLGVVVAATYVASRALARPLKRLKQALDDAASGDFNFRISHNRTDEFGELFDAFNRLSASMHDRLDSIEAIALDQDGPAVATDALASTQTSIKPPAKDLQNSVFSPPLNFQRTPPPPSVEERSEAARSDEAGSVPKPVETHVEATAIDAATIEAAPMETPRAEPPSQEPQSLAPLSLEALTSEALSSEALSSEALSSEALSSEAATLEPPSQEPSRIEPTKVDASQALQTAAPAPSPFTPAPMEASSTDLGAAGPAPSSAGKPIRRRRPKVVPETRPELTAPPPVPAQAAAPASPKTHDDDRTVIDVLQDAQRKS